MPITPFATIVNEYRTITGKNIGTPLPKKGSNEHKEVLENRDWLDYNAGRKVSVKKVQELLRPYDSSRYDTYTVKDFTTYKKYKMIPPKDIAKLKKLGVWNYI